MTAVFTPEWWQERQVEAEKTLGISHRDGIWWYKAPVPGRFHRCSPWTISTSDQIERCACGGLRYFGDSPLIGWMGRLHWWQRRPKR